MNTGKVWALGIIGGILIIWATVITINDPGKLSSFLGITGIALFSLAMRDVLEARLPYRKIPVERRRNHKPWPKYKDRRQYRAYGASRV